MAIRASWLGTVISHSPIPQRVLSHASNLRRFNSRAEGCLSLLTPNPHHVGRDDLVSRLPVLPHRSETSNVVPVFLLSSAFAPWLYGSPSLRDIAVNQVFRDAVHSSAEDDPYYAVFAVVDKLPLPASFPSSVQRQLGGRTPDLEKRGCEGLSVFLADKKTLFGSTFQKAARRDVAAAAEPDPALLYDTAVCGASAAGDSISSVEVATRLANTIFTTGQPHTLIATRWDYAKEAGKLTLQDTRHLAHLRIRSPSNAASSAYPSAPLHAITHPRKIITGMGNVISQISAENEAQRSVPASSELERIIPEYVREHDMENQIVAVWALITPDANESKTVPNSNAEGVTDSLAKGGRLLRVTGGGGGWGKKQGLLSLDPEYRFEKDVDSSSEAPIKHLFEDQMNNESSAESLDQLPRFLLSSSKELDTSSSLAALAKPGAMVQFFVASLDRPDTTASSTKANDGAVVRDDQPSTRTFGVIPRTEEGLPSTVNDTTAPTPTGGVSSATDDKIIELPNHFGALSEKSVTWATFERHDPGEPSPFSSPKKVDELSGTKLDVPGSRIIIEY